MKRVELLGAVLAGGESRRFGSDKAAALIAGKSLVVRAAETLSRVFTRVVIVSSKRPAATDGWPHVRDAREAHGPLAGIEAALGHAAELGLDGAFVLACDLPLVDEATVRAVAGALGDRLAAAPSRDGTPAMEPLCAAYRVGCLPFVARALGEGRLGVHPVFEAVGGATTRVEGDVFLNVNSPADRQRAAAVLEDGSR